MAANEKPQSSAGLVGVLDRIAKGLEGQPALQVVIGGAILLVVLATAVGGVAADQLWLFVLALVVLVLAGLGAWLVKSRGDADPGFRSTLDAGEDVRARDRAQIMHHEGEPPARGQTTIKAGGTVEASGDARVGGSSSRPAGRDARERPEAPSAPDPGG